MNRLEQLIKPLTQMSHAEALAFVATLRADRKIPKAQGKRATSAKVKSSRRTSSLSKKADDLTPEQALLILKMLGDRNAS